MKEYPAIEVCGASTDSLLAAVDDFSPTAIEERDTSVRVFFSTTESRDAACAALAPQFDAVALDVPDEDWARRSQENLKPVTVGLITVAPPWAVSDAQRFFTSHQPPATSHQPPIVITVLPSMGFGTGHHATTRLCLAALQAVDVAGRVALDVGTGSGVLAMAAARLGATRVAAIDVDADAIQSARENLDLNPDVTGVTIELADLASAAVPSAQIVTANLTGALLVGSAPRLRDAVDTGGVLILSGLQAHERQDVCRAFESMAVFWEREEDGWVGLAMKKT